jgi:hypothetical protein
MIEVCTVYTARPGHAQWRDDYIDLLSAQKASAQRFDNFHRVVTDTPIDGFNCMQAALPADLMQAMIAGVLARLDMATRETHFVFVDADVLIGRPLGPVFRRAREFDISLTYRANDLAPINNGVMYVHKDGIGPALMFYREALRLCGTHWGADQEAISQAAAPVPQEPGFGERSGAVVRFVSSKIYAPVPRAHGIEHVGAPAVHFKGATKDWMLDYARLFCGYGG